MRHAVLTPFFGKLRDHFCEYGAPLSVEEKLERAAKVPGVEGVEVVFPDECGEPLGEMLEALHLAPAAINVNLKGRPEFQNGALSSPDSGVRTQALALLKQGKQLAQQLGADKVTCAPLADGYDYPFHTDYRKAWTRMVDVLGDAAEFCPEVALHLEHKPAEPRVRGLLDSAAKVLCLCHDIGHSRVGITFNAGHAFYGGGTPAEAFAQVLFTGVPYYIHSCDGTENWDWDLLAGSRHLWQWAEFLYYLKEDGYQGWITADVFPVRQDAAELFAANVRLTNRIWNWLGTLDHALPTIEDLENCLPLP